MSTPEPEQLSRQAFLADVLECAAAFSFQAAVLPRLTGGTAYVPDFLMLVLAYKAVTRPLGAAVALTAFCALGADAFGPGYLFGTHLIVKLPVILIFNFISQSIPREKKFLPYLVVIAAGTLLHNLLMAGMLALKGVLPFASLAAAAFAQALISSAAGMLMLGLYSLTRGTSHGRYSR